MEYVGGRRHPESFYNLLKESSITSSPFVLLEASLVREDQYSSLFFQGPVEELVLEEPDEWGGFFDSINSYLARGFWLAGWFSYEVGYLLEKRFRSCLDTKLPKYPLAWLGVFEGVKRYVHEKSGPSAPVMVTKEDIGEISGLHLKTDEGEYKRAIERIKEYIRAGDTYQVNYTIRGAFDFNGDPVDLYEALRASQPVPYGGVIRRGNLWILSLSPELFFRIDGGRIVSRPMKGTVRRGRHLVEDVQLARWLKNDEKNRAENVMIVDLIRNDLGRLSRPGSVRVPRLFEVERYETLFQMTSTVEGELKWDKGLFDVKEVFRAIFPCGSVTGAPKIRTMEIIGELEQHPRGVYCGAIGFMHRDQAQFNVAIRTLTLMDGTGEIGIGSGVTMDSDPLGEYRESVLKMQFVRERFEDFYLIETMRVDPDGKVYLLDEHMERLEKSALYFDFFFDKERVLSAIEEAIRASHWGQDLEAPFILRLSLYRDGTVEFRKRAMPDHQEGPVPITLSTIRMDPNERFLYHKTSRRTLFDQELESARKNGFYEAVFLNTSGELTQGTITNIFLERGGTLLTPPLDAGLLPGTLRAHLLKEGRAQESPLVLDDLGSGQLYIGNSVRGLIRARIDLSR